jgi:CelD/BcsL family acetyltransferase involved in cellulose biosynthesis
VKRTETFYESEMEMSAVPERIQLVQETEAEVEVEVVPASEWPAVERDWSELANRSPYRSYFLGSDWIASWIETYGSHLDIEILRFSSASRTIGMCLVVWRTQRRGPVWVRRAFLNASGEDECEEVGTEFNDLLCLAGWEEQAATALRRYLNRRDWDEFVMNGCRRSQAVAALRSVFAGYQEQVHTVPSHHIDLDAIRRSGSAFEMSLSYKVRYNIRQSRKLYLQTGELHVHRAESVAEARSMLQELAAFHQQRWEKAGRSGAFASPRFQRFHDAVISRCFSKDEVDLIRVSAGPEAIGVLYNYVADGKAYFYQCGFRFSENKRLRPGLVTLESAIQWYANSGLPEFDLMAGDMEYKRSLTETFRPLDWCTVRRPTWRNTLVDLLRRCRTRFRSLTAKSGHGGDKPQAEG